MEKIDLQFLEQIILALNEKYRKRCVYFAHEISALRISPAKRYGKITIIHEIKNHSTEARKIV